MKFLFPVLFLFVITVRIYAGQADSIAAIIEDYIDENDPVLPVVDFIIEQNIRDVSICSGPMGTYYLTGTAGDINGVQEGIKVWASRDLKNWNLIGTDGYVWTFEFDAVDWQKVISDKNGYRKRGIIAPEIHYLKNNFWITYTNSNSNQSGILRSLSGKAQGPYVEVTGKEPLVTGSDASLFMDSDSSVYFIWNGCYARKMNDDMSNFTGADAKVLSDEAGSKITLDNVSIRRLDGKYILTGKQYNGLWSSDRNDGFGTRSDAAIAASRSFTGPYRIQKTRVPHAGGGMLFQDKDKQLWFTISGSDISSPVSGNPAVIQMQQTDNGEIIPVLETSFKAGAANPVVYVSTFGDNSTGNDWMHAFTSLQRAIDNAPVKAQIWVAEGKYEAPVQISLRKGLYIYGGFSGVEERLEQRDPERYRSVINGRNYAKHVISISGSSFIRLDGLTIQGGNASGGSFHLHYGGGIHILSGGETIRIVNCQFENNKADQDGGALYVSVGAAPTVINCTFKNNVAKNNGGAATIYCNNTNGFHTRFFNCTFDNNFAYGDGGAIYFDTNERDFGLLTMVNALVVNNTSLKDGGAIALDRNANLLLLNSTFSLNKGTSQGTVVANFGNVPGKSRVVNSIFYQNYGGMLFSIEGEAETITSNNKVYYPNIWVQFSNCLFDDNDVSALVQRNFDRKKWRTVYELNESVIGEKCIQGTPAFTDPANGNFLPNSGSKAKGTGTTKYYFKYNLEGKRRTESINIGCY